MDGTGSLRRRLLLRLLRRLLRRSRLHHSFREWWFPRWLRWAVMAIMVRSAYMILMVLCLVSSEKKMNDCVS